MTDLTIGELQEIVYDLEAKIEYFESRLNELARVSASMWEALTKEGMV